MKMLKKLVGKGQKADHYSAGTAPAGTAPTTAPPPPKPGITPSSLPPSPAPAGPQQCGNKCGWTAFAGHTTCCKVCCGPEGPHAKDCATKNPRWIPLCQSGCGRPCFASFTTCCPRCLCPEGPHSRDCAKKVTENPGYDRPKAPKTQDEVLDELRCQLADWQAKGITKTRAQVDEIIKGLAKNSGMEHQTVRMLWLTVAKQARPVGAPAQVYIELAKKHHSVDVEVIDLGQFSAKQSNSCMFLTCAAALADRRAQGYADALPPGALGAAIAAAAPGGNATESIEELIAQHRRTRAGTLGRMADALRHAACEILTFEEDVFLPYFSPMRYGTSGKGGGIKQAYTKWIENLRGNEEGDELVILALSRLLGIAVQPVQQSGYRVPLMDPTGSAADDAISYWGNDDAHWVWLRPVGEGMKRPAHPLTPETVVPADVIAVPVTDSHAVAASSAVTISRPAVPTTSTASGPAAAPAAAAPAAAAVDAKETPADEGEYPIGLF